MRKLTHNDTLALQDTVLVGGDLLLLPQELSVFEEARAYCIARNQAPNEAINIRDFSDLSRLEVSYNAERFLHGTEPEWVKDKPVSVIKWLRRSFAITELDPLAIINELPHTGIFYMIIEGGLCESVYHNFGIGRLGNIAQLGFLQSPLDNNAEVAYRTSFASNRLVHSYDVMAIASMIGRNLRLSKKQFNTLRVAALTHDVATPAGGDSVKLVDPASLDEDRNYARFTERCDWSQVREKYGVEKALLFRTIANKGLLGEILDIADKLAYVGRDIKSFRYYIEGGLGADRHGLDTLNHLVKSFPYVCSTWDSVMEHENRPVFTSIPRLAAFLKVRVLLFREFYYHPRARFGEFMMSRLLVKALYKKGKLTADMLLSMSDYELLQLISNEYGTGKVYETMASDLARCETFYSVREAHDFMARLRAEGNLFAMCDDNTGAIKPATNFLVKTIGGVKTLKEAEPEIAREIEEMAELLPRVHVYYLDGIPALGADKLNELVEFLREDS